MRARSPNHATQLYNSGSLVSPGGEWVGRYNKMHLVPFGEYVPFKRVFGFAGGLTKEVGDFSPGTSRAPLQAGNKLGVFICYESIFPDEIRQLAANGAEVFVNISNDGWYGDSGAYAQHLKQARMRAVENDRWLLRDTNTGVTAVDRSLRKSCLHHSAQSPGRSRCPLRPDQRNHVLHPSRRLVRLPVCDNFCSGTAAQFPVPRQDRSSIMNEELEHEYAGLKDQVRDLREYL